MRVLASPAVLRCVSVLLALFAGFLCHVHELIGEAQAAAVAGALTALAGSMFGASLSAASILISGTGKRLISNMRLTGHLQRISRELIVMALLWLAVLLMCICALVFDGHAQANRWLLSASVSVTLLALFAAVSTGRKMALVLLYWGDD